MVDVSLFPTEGAIAIREPAKADKLMKSLRAKEKAVQELPSQRVLLPGSSRFSQVEVMLPGNVIVIIPSFGFVDDRCFGNLNPECIHCTAVCWLGLDQLQRLDKKFCSSLGSGPVHRSAS